MKAYDHDLAISAVGYDSLLVRELMGRLEPRLEQSAVWAQPTPDLPEPEFPLLGRGARVVVVLLHPLWSREPRTAADSGVLRQRMKRHPESVVVLVLDGATVPEWLEAAHQHDFTAEGLDPVVATILATVASRGGPVRAEVEPTSPGFMFNTPTPFMEQARAQMALKRELEQIAVELHERLNDEDEDAVDVFSLPNRFIARQHDRAISFSWIAGRGGALVDGRLLVIEWGSVPRTVRGVPALKDAISQREVVYTAQGAGADSWCWRADQPHGRACSTADLVGEWLDAVSLRAAQQHEMA